MDESRPSPAQRGTLERAAAAIAEADALLIGAGAGMGVDSGLPDFRGDEGFWRAYPPIARLGISFAAMANPRWFRDDPAFAWGFYGHRLNLYRETTPHEGFAILRRFGGAAPRGAFVFTSNVDGQFQRAGFTDARVVECHGSIHHLQCAAPCCGDIWSAEDARVEVEMSTLRAREPLPACRRCGHLARPNILMFGDFAWLGDRSSAQEAALAAWLSELPADARVVAIECGAGTAIPSVRMTCERVTRARGGALIRINPREAHGPRGTLSLAMGAAAALRELDSMLPGRPA